MSAPLKPANHLTDPHRLIYTTRPTTSHASHAHRTFHFYDPRQFTHQPNGETTGQYVRWESATGAARVAAIFDAVRDALPTLPVYVGEFGLDVHRSFESGTSDEIGWLRCKHGFELRCRL